MPPKPTLRACLVVGLASVFLLLTGLFGWYVWPTPYRYDHIQLKAELLVPVRINRMTGEAEMLYTSGWQDMSPNVRQLPALDPKLRYFVLSNGVGEPRTGPYGPLINFTVHYVGEPRQSSSKPLFWVIERARGDSVTQAFRLKGDENSYGYTRPSGTLSTSLSGWRLEDGPFYMHIDDDESQLSKSVELR
jgi:hypothetical protein